VLDVRTLATTLLLGAVVLAGCSGPADGAGSQSAAPKSAAASTLADRTRAVAEIARADVAAGVVPGATVVLADDSGEQTLAFGVSDSSHGTPMRGADRFRIASITKSMTAALVLQLADDGLLDLDDTAESWLPGLLPNGDEITLAQLLGHVSGLPEADDGPFVGTHGVTGEDVLRTIADEPVEAPPGELLAYRNVNFVALGMVAERATGRPLSRLLRDRLFDPLGMTTARLAREGHPGPHLVHAYEGGEDVTDLDVYWAQGAGGVTATANDVSRFYRGLFGGAVVPNTRLADMMAARDDDILGWNGYGLGLAAIETDCGTALGHGGRLPGISTEAWTIRATGRSVVIFANADGRSTQGTLDSIREAALCD